MKNKIVKNGKVIVSDKGIQIEEFSFKTKNISDAQFQAMSWAVRELHVAIGKICVDSLRD